MIRLIWKPEKREDASVFAGGELIAHLQLLPLWREWERKHGDYPVTLTTDNSLSEDGQDAYRYEFTQWAGCVTGSNARSVLLGVYGYLRDVGFVFLSPGKGGTHVPEIGDADRLFCSSKICTASCYHRGVCIEGANSLENALDFVDWLPKNGYNSFFQQFRKPDIFFERWYRHLNNPRMKEESVTRKGLDAMEAALTRAMKQRGILDHRVGHGWTAEALGCPGNGWYRETKELAEDKKAWVAQIGGVRQLCGGIPANTNLCYSNPLVRRRLADLVVTYAKNHPHTDYLHFWLADECNNICECSECSQTTPADQYVEILNEIDRRLTREGLATVIVFLLYQELLYAPLKEKLHHTRRFCLMFAPISRTFEESYPGTAVSVPVPEYERNRFRLPRTLEENLTHYYRWKKWFQGDSFFYDYPLGRAHYGDFGYMKIARIIYEDIHALKALGAGGYMSCQELRAGLPNTFPNYVMGRSLLEDTLTYEEIKQSYFQALYGKYSGRVMTVLETLSEYSDVDYFNGHGPRYQPEKQKDFIKIEETARAFLEELPSMWPDEKEDHSQRTQLSFHANYCILLSRALGALCRGCGEEASLLFGEFCGYIQAEERNYQPVLDVYRVIEVAEKYTGFGRNHV